MASIQQSLAESGFPESVRDAVVVALEDEYKAAAFYDAILTKFGPVRPFVNIVEAERRHASRLEGLLSANGYEIPDNLYQSGQLAAPEVPETLKQACQMGIDAEIENAALYEDKLLPAADGYPEVTGAMNDLMNASIDRHLPAFQRCATRGSGNGRGGV